MLQQVRPNRWSCLLTAFANSLEVLNKDLVNIIGHDGSELIRQDYPPQDPRSRRGFHPQELLDACLQMGWSPIRLDDQAMGVHPEDTTTVQLGQQRLWDHLLTSGNGGVLEYMTPVGAGHAISFHTFDDQIDIVDPSDGSLYSTTKDGLNPRELLAVWLLRK